MSQPRILAIEDDRIAAESLKIAVESLGYTLIDIVDEIKEFSRLVKATLPDLMILDIDLGDELNGIELAHQVSKEYDIPFLYTTSMRDIKTVKDAVESAPSAFLTKPYDSASLQAAIELAVTSKQVNSNSQNDSSTAKSLFIKDEHRFIKVSTDELYFIEAQNKQCKLQLNNCEKIITAKIAELSNQLPKDKFIQIHRSFIINLEKVAEIDSQYKCLTIGKSNIPIGRRYKELLMTKLLKIG